MAEHPGSGTRHEYVCACVLVCQYPRAQAHICVHKQDVTLLQRPPPTCNMWQLKSQGHEQRQRLVCIPVDTSEGGRSSLSSCPVGRGARHHLPFIPQKQVCAKGQGHDCTLESYYCHPPLDCWSLHHAGRSVPFPGSWCIILSMFSGTHRAGRPIADGVDSVHGCKGISVASVFCKSPSNRGRNR